MAVQQHSDRLWQPSSWFSLWFDIHLHWLRHLTLYTQLFKKWKRLKYNKSVTSRRRILITAKKKTPNIKQQGTTVHTHTRARTHTHTYTHTHTCTERWTRRRSFPYAVQFIIIIIMIAVIVKQKGSYSCRGEMWKKKLEAKKKKTPPQDQTLLTKFHAIKILQTETDSECSVNTLIRQWNTLCQHVQC